MNFNLQHLRDEEVDADLDRRLRALLLQCFPREAHHLETKRYFHECPRNRWFAFDKNGVLAAHVAGHEKTFGVVDGAGEGVSEEELRVIGIAEVCVEPRFRGQGLVKALLQEAHQWGKEHGFSFAVLAGDRRFYTSSGYKCTQNRIALVDPTSGEKSVKVRPIVMFAPLGEKAWPEGEIDLRGPLF